MKYLLYLFLLSSFACNSGSGKEAPVAQVASDSDGVTSGVVDVAAFVKLMEKDHLLLDVRTPEEFAEGYIANATNINFYDDDFAQKATALQKDKPLLVYCKKGGRSAKAYKILRKAGFEKVYDLDGGFTAWQSAKQPIAK